MPTRDLLLGLMVVLLWGFNIVTAKWGVAAIPPLFFTALRFAAVAVLVVPFFPLPRSAWRPILILSVTFGTGGFGLMFTSFTLLEGSTAAIVQQLVVPFSVIVGIVALGERPGWRRLSGIGLALAGIVLIAGEPGRAPLAGMLLMAGSAASTAIGNLYLKKLTMLPPLGVVGWMSLLAVPQLAVLSLLLEDGQVAALGQADGRVWLSLLYTVIAASIIAHSLWAGLVRRHELSRIVPFALLAPVTSVLCATAFLGEPLTPLKVVGGLVTMAGVAVIQLRQATRAPNRPAIETPAETATPGGAP
ncbi:DMT family transporter [Caenispirillum salinarum]|uniref:DMT family transporter n=1 Tax=Caenispirillum salinarum TaxID=859058 RepID=UPI00384DE651